MTNNLDKHETHCIGLEIRDGMTVVKCMTCCCRLFSVPVGPVHRLHLECSLELRVNGSAVGLYCCAGWNREPVIEVRT